jgi:hypothetical protein
VPTLPQKLQPLAAMFYCSRKILKFTERFKEILKCRREGELLIAMFIIFVELEI